MARATPALSEAAVPKGQAAAQERKYRAEEALRTLVRADEILADSALVKDALALAKEQHLALASLLGDLGMMHHHHSQKGKPDAGK